MNGLKSDEKKVVNIYLNSKKFREYENTDYQKLCFFLLKKCADFGKEKPPLFQEIINWVIEIGKNYPNLSIEDVDLAFSLAVTGQLVWRDGDEYKNQNLDKFVWETFLTICKVLTAYQEYKKLKLKEYNRLLNEYKSSKESEDIYEKMWNQYVSDWKSKMKQSYELYRSKGVFDLEDTYCSFYQQLSKCNLLNITQSEIDSIKAKVKPTLDELVKEKIKTIAGIQLKDIAETKSKLKKDLFQVRCCTMALEMQFQKWKKNNINVILLINKMQLKK